MVVGQAAGPPLLPGRGALPACLLVRARSGVRGSGGVLLGRARLLGSLTELPDDDEDGVECCVTCSCPVAVGTLSTYSFGAELVSDGDGAGVLGAGVEVVGSAGAVAAGVEVAVGVDAAEGVVVWASALPPRPNTAAQARPAITT